MPSPYSILEPVCSYTGANIHSNLPPKTPQSTICRRVPTQAELSSAKKIFASTVVIFIILLLPWLLLGIKFLEHPQKYYIMGLGVLLHLNTCLFVYTEGVAMGMMYIRSVGCSPVQEWERQEAEEGERYSDEEAQGAVELDIEKIAAKAQDAPTTQDNVRSFSPVGGLDREFTIDAAAQGTMHGQFGP